MEAQSIFDKVWNHFVVNKGAPSVGDSGRGKYRKSGKADDPCRCAAGLFIPDEQYDPVIDLRGGMRISGVMRGYTPFGNSETAKELLPHESLLMRLQNAHDDATTSNVFHAEIEAK